MTEFCLENLEKGKNEDDNKDKTFKQNSEGEHGNGSQIGSVTDKLLHNNQEDMNSGVNDNFNYKFQVNNYRNSVNDDGYDGYDGHNENNNDMFEISNIMVNKQIYNKKYEMLNQENYIETNVHYSQNDRFVNINDIQKDGNTKNIVLDETQTNNIIPKTTNVFVNDNQGDNYIANNDGIKYDDRNEEVMFNNNNMGSEGLATMDHENFLGNFNEKEDKYFQNETYQNRNFYDENGYDYKRYEQMKYFYKYGNEEEKELEENNIVSDPDAKNVYNTGNNCYDTKLYENNFLKEKNVVSDCDNEQNDKNYINKPADYDTEENENDFKSKFYQYPNTSNNEFNKNIPNNRNQNFQATQGIYDEYNDKNNDEQYNDNRKKTFVSNFDNCDKNTAISTEYAKNNGFIKNPGVINDSVNNLYNKYGKINEYTQNLHEGTDYIENFKNDEVEYKGSTFTEFGKGSSKKFGYNINYSVSNTDDYNRNYNGNNYYNNLNNRELKTINGQHVKDCFGNDSSVNNHNKNLSYQNNPYATHNYSNFNPYNYNQNQRNFMFNTSKLGRKRMGPNSLQHTNPVYNYHSQVKNYNNLNYKNPIFNQEPFNKEINMAQPSYYKMDQSKIHSKVAHEKEINYSGKGSVYERRDNYQNMYYDQLRNYNSFNKGRNFENEIVNEKNVNENVYPGNQGYEEMLQKNYLLENNVNFIGKKDIEMKPNFENYNRPEFHYETKFYNPDYQNRAYENENPEKTLTLSRRPSYTGSKESESNYESEDDKKKNKRKKRVRLTSEKTLYLQRYFEVKPRPSTAEKREISKRLAMNFRSVQVWFQNRRAKQKKDMNDMSNTLTYDPMYNARFFGEETPGHITNLARNNSLFVKQDENNNVSVEMNSDMENKNSKVYKFHDLTDKKFYGRGECFWTDYDENETGEME